MLITDDFVVINFPKTGSTYVRNRIKEVYQNLKFYHRKGKLIELLLPNIRTKSGINNKIVSQHGIYAQIPDKFEKREVISVVRNPYERLYSLYTFKWWAKIPSWDINLAKEKYRKYPDITFNEFVDLFYTEGKNDFLFSEKLKTDIGIQSI